MPCYLISYQRLIIIQISCFLLFVTFCQITSTQSHKTMSISSNLIRKASELSSNFQSLFNIRAGFGGGVIGIDSEDELEDDNIIIIDGCPNTLLNGQYIKMEDEINGLPHYERVVINGQKNDTYHLFWSGNQWIINKDMESFNNSDNSLAYAKVKVKHVIDTSRSWNVRVGKSYEAALNVIVTNLGNSVNEKEGSGENSKIVDEVFGIPKKLVPLFLAFMLDSIAVGMAMPLLPFFVMDLGAKALQLSFVISSNYIVQMVGCLAMGSLSDRIGRKFVLLCCLAASSISYFSVSRSATLLGIVLSRIIVGSCGGLVPVMQTCVADVSNPKERPKYLGRVTATFGLGFVLGPAISALLPNLTIRQKIRASALLPLIGFLIALFFFKETRAKLDTSDNLSVDSTTTAISLSNTMSNTIFNSNSGRMYGSNHNHHLHHSNLDKKGSPVGLPIVLLVLNGFLIMYAFATETIYAMFLKDSFGYGERTLSSLFAINGLFIGIFQIFFIKPMVNNLGKHITLIVGNLMLAIGMVGIALVRKETFHFILFTAHIVGYSIADTALASLITRYSNPSSQGRDLALNQAAQSCARVLSPLFAGMLYEKSKLSSPLPIGALPFLAGALFPFLGILVPGILYVRNANLRKKKTPKESHS